MSEDSLIRLFVALPIPEFVCEKLALLRSDLPQLRWIEREEMHLTLKFIGEVESQGLESIKEGLCRLKVQPFLVSVSGVGVFPERGDPAVLWAGFGSAHPRLFQLHKKVNDTLFSMGIEPDRRVYRPHLTLSRCRGVSRRVLQPFLRKHAELETAPFRIDSFKLYSSQWTVRGSKYKCIQSYGLGH